MKNVNAFSLFFGMFIAFLTVTISIFSIVLFQPIGNKEVVFVILGESIIFGIFTTIFLIAAIAAKKQGV